MSVLDEVLAANEAYAADFGEKGEPGAAARARLRDPHLHGRAPGPGEVRGPERGRRPRHPQRRRPRERRRDPLARHLPQAARHGRVVRHPPYRTAAWSSSRTRSWATCSQSSLETAALGDEGFYDVGDGPRLDRGQEHRLADDLRPGRRRRRGRQKIRNHPLVDGTIPVYGYVYDVETGKLVEVPAGDRGRPRDGEQRRVAEVPPVSLPSAG